MLHDRWPVLLTLIVVAGCTPSPAGAPNAPVADAPGSPLVGPPEQRSLKHIVEQPGRVEALAQTAVYAKIAGFVTAWHKDIGDAVEPGTPLADIGIPELE